MKYTNQILYGEVNIHGLISNNKYLRPATVVMTLPVAIFGVILFGLALLPAAGMDFGRYVRLAYLRQVKIYHRINYITDVVGSLTTDKNVQNQYCKLLTEMI